MSKNFAEQESLPDFSALVKALNDAGAQVVLIGGQAMIAHGSDYQTRDIDFAFSRQKENLRAIVKALEGFNPRPRDFPSDLPFVWDEVSLGNSTSITLATTEGMVDFLAEPSGAPPFKELLAGGLHTSYNGLPVVAASIEHLISMKTAAGRPKDLAHIEELKSLQKLIDEVALD
jgi:predicted nucleotidyltransferase